MQRGVFITLEGTDDYVTNSQYEQLVARLLAKGHDVVTIAFPCYGQASSHFVRQYQSGKYGAAEDIGPYTASLFYALDHYEAAPVIRRVLEQGKIVLARHFAGANMAQQGAWFASAEERRGYFIWLDNLEFQMLAIPRADYNFVLRATHTDSTAQRGEEQLPVEQEKVVEVYDDLTQLFPKDFTRVDCVRNGQQLSSQEIQKLLWEKVTPKLPPRTGKRGTHSALAPAAAEQSTPTTPAQKQGNNKTGRNILETSTSFTLIDVSQLLLQRLWQLPSAGQAVRATEHEQHETRGKAGKYPYFVPLGLNQQTKQQYCDGMDTLFDTHRLLVHELSVCLASADGTSRRPSKEQLRKATIKARTIASAVLPIAKMHRVQLPSTPALLEPLARGLLTTELPEARATGQHVYDEARLRTPDRHIRQVQPDAMPTNILRHIAEESLPMNYSDQAEPITMMDVWPRNEFDLVADMLYEHSDQPLAAIRREVSEWSYNQKLAVFEAYLEDFLTGKATGEALQKANYSLDVMSEYSCFQQFQAQQVGNVEWQQLTPRFGYEVPRLLEEAGLVDEFEMCFDLSIKLYSLLQGQGHALEAQYATLLGHKMRWKVTLNGREVFHLHEFRTGAQVDPGYRKLILQMHEKLAEKHPLLAEALLYVGQDEAT